MIPVSTSAETKRPLYRQPVAIALVFILLILSVLAFVGWYWGGSLERPISLSLEQKEQILENLKENSSSTIGFASKQEQQILNSLIRSTTSGSGLDTLNKNEILKTLSK